MIEGLKDRFVELRDRAVELREINFRQELFGRVYRDGGTIVFREGNNSPVSVSFGNRYTPEREERFKQALLRQASDPVSSFSFTYLGRDGNEIGYYGEEIASDNDS